MAARLIRCTGLWGTNDRIADDPPRRRLAEAVYRPWSIDPLWGLFAEGRRIGDGLPDPSPRAAETVHEGPFLYIGPLVTHYGHFLVNTLPMLWPLLSWSGPRPRILCHMPGGRSVLDRLPFVAPILDGLGLGVADLVAFDEPVRVTEVVLPQPALREQAAVHDVFATLCRQIGRPLWRDVAVDGARRPVYLSKTRLTSGVACAVNEQAIVDELDRRGVDIAFPETLSLAEQVRLLSHRRIVMGTVGSAFHTVAFAAPGRRLVGLNWQPSLNANFALIDACNAARARYYFPHGTAYEAQPGWELAWSVADPRGVADALRRRADWLARDEPDDEGVYADARRLALRPFRRR